VNGALHEILAWKKIPARQNQLTALLFLGSLQFTAFSLNTLSLTTRCNNKHFIISSTAIQFDMRSLHIQFQLYPKRMRPMLSSVSTICPHQNTTSSIPLDLVLLQKLKNQLPNLHRVRLPHKVACIQQMNFRLGQIPFERLSAWWNENRIILSPNSQ
jgi:hypothetical protein